MDRFKSTALALLAIVLGSSHAMADVPQNMTVQGRLTTAGGGPAPAGLKSFTFKIFDVSAAGTEIWPNAPGEVQLLATDANGIWTARVGAVIPLTDGVFEDSSRWLEVTVDDGVNPPETLPRLKLNKAPYSPDLYVNATGDEMRGRLHNTWTQKNVGASVEVDNQNDGLGPIWNDAAGTWGVVADVSGDANNWNIALAASAIGTNNISEANRGLYAIAGGSGSANIGVEGTTMDDGITNYSGYFHNGDFVVAQPSNPGTAGVQLPADVIDNTEILDEPGIAVNTSSGSILGISPAGMVDLITVEITTPNDGYILVDGTFYGWAGGSAISDATGYAQIDEIAGGFNTVPYVRAWGELAPNTSGNRFYPVNVTRVFFKPAGTYTFRIEVMGATVSGTGLVTAAYPMITATYFPHAYGTVTAVVAAGDAADFDNVRALPPASMAGGASKADGPETPLVAVDLRDLELRALRARAEAERAERALLEARLSSTGSVIPNATQEK